MFARVLEESPRSATLADILTEIESQTPVRRPSILQRFVEELKTVNTVDEVCNLKEIYDERLFDEWGIVRENAKQRILVARNEEANPHQYEQGGEYENSWAAEASNSSDYGFSFGPFSVFWATRTHVESKFLEIIGETLLAKIQFSRTSMNIGRLCANTTEWLTISDFYPTSEYFDAIALYNANGLWGELERALSYDRRIDDEFRISPPTIGADGDDEVLSNSSETSSFPAWSTILSGELSPFYEKQAPIWLESWRSKYFSEEDECRGSFCGETDPIIALAESDQKFGALLFQAVDERAPALYTELFVQLSRLFPNVRNIELRNTSVSTAWDYGLNGMSPFRQLELFDRVAIAGANDIILNLSGANFGSLYIGESNISEIALQDSTIRDGITIEDSNVGKSINFHDSAIGSAAFRNITAIPFASDLAPIFGDEDPEGASISGYGATVSGEISFDELRGFSRVILGQSESKVIRFTNVDLSEGLNVWGANAEVMLLYGVQFNGAIEGPHASIGRIGVYNSIERPSQIEEVSLSYLRSDRGVAFNNFLGGNIAFNNAVLGSFDIDCATLAGSLELDNTFVDGLLMLSNVSAIGLKGNFLHADRLRIDYPAVNAETTTSDDAGLQFSKPCERPRGIQGLLLPSATIDSLFSELQPNAFVNFREIASTSTTLVQARNASTVAASIKLDIRNANLGRLMIDPQLFQGQRDDGRSQSIDLTGATFSSIRVADFSADDTNGFVISSQQDYGSYRDLLYNAILPALGLSVDKRADTPYRGADYIALRNAALVAGFPDIERTLAIAQNDHYGLQSGNSFIRSVYFISSAINQYGYNNGRAIVWLIAIWFMGWLLLISPNAISAAAKLDGASSGESKSRVSQKGSPFLLSMFLSLDRTIPVLNLDAKFSEIYDNSSFESTSRLWGGLFRYGLYVQRILAYMVLLFMLGGVFNIFL